MDSSIFKQYLTPTTYTKEEFLKYSTYTAMENYVNAGYSVEKAEKMVNKYAVKNIDDIYKTYTDNRLVWNNSIESTFSSIKDYVAKSDSDDDW